MDKLYVVLEQCVNNETAYLFTSLSWDIKFLHPSHFAVNTHENDTLHYAAHDTRLAHWHRKLHLA